MSADLHIHVLEGATEEDFVISKCNALGSKYFNLDNYHLRKEVDKRIDYTPNIWIGEVSWLKASLFGDSENFIPSTVQQISDIIGEDLPIVDDNLINNIIKAFEVDNKTSYNVTKVKDIKEFLEQYKGKKLFTINW